MKKPVVIILIIVAGIGAAAFGYWTISPLFIDVRVSEEMPQSERITKDESGITKEPVSETVAMGDFRGLQGHSASGTAKLLKVGDKNFVRFEDNFDVTNGPDLFVYLGKNGQYDPAANLGNLKGNIGSQNYEIPAGINLVEYDSVWVWCRAFSVAFGSADFK